MAGSAAPEEIILRNDYWRYAVLASAAPALITAGLWFGGWGIHLGGFTLPYWLITGITSAMYYAASCFMIQTEEFAGVTVLEVPALELEKGFVYAPLLLCEVERFPRGISQHQFPGEPEEISKVSDAEADRMTEKFLRPIRVATANEDADGDPDDPLNARLVLEPTFTVIWQVERAGFFQFYTNVPGSSYAEKMLSILKLMRDTGEKALNIEISKRSAAKVTSEKEEIANAVLTRIANDTRSWGIRICEVNVLSLEPDHATNNAINGIVQAKATAKSTLVAVGAETESIVKRAEAKAQERRILGQAEGDALKAEADASGISAETILATRAAIEIGKDNAKFVVGGSILDMVKGLIGGAK